MVGTTVFTFRFSFTSPGKHEKMSNKAHKFKKLFFFGFIQMLAIGNGGLRYLLMVGFGL